MAIIKDFKKYTTSDYSELVLPESFVNVCFYEGNEKKTNYTFDGEVMQDEEFVKKFFDLISYGLKISNESKADVIFKKKQRSKKRGIT